MQGDLAKVLVEKFSTYTESSTKYAGKSQTKLAAIKEVSWLIFFVVLCDVVCGSLKLTQIVAVTMQRMRMLSCSRICSILEGTISTRSIWDWLMHLLVTVSIHFVKSCCNGCQTTCLFITWRTVREPILDCLFKWLEFMHPCGATTNGSPMS